MLLAAAHGNLEPQNCFFFAKKCFSKCKKMVTRAIKYSSPYYSTGTRLCLPLLPPPLLHANSNPLSRLLLRDSLRVDCWKRHGSRSSFPRRGPSPSSSLQKHLLSPSIHGLTTTHPSPHSPHRLSLRGGHYFELLAPRPRSTCTQGFSAHVCVLYIRVVAVDSGRASLFRAEEHP